VKATSTSAPSSFTTPSLTDAEHREVARLNGNFFSAYQKESSHAAHAEVLKQYVSLRQVINERGVQFGLVNNRLYVGLDHLMIPYLLGKSLLVYRVREGSPDALSTYKVRNGAIITDAYLAQLTGFEGGAVDLESDLYDLNPDRCKPVRVGHVRDMASQLQRMAQSANQAEATYLLRTLVAQTSLLSFKEYLSAKNLQSEVRRLTEQLLGFLNSPLSYQLPFLVRILVRNISGVVSKPKLIDRLWNDTIDLAEVHLTGSDIVNEIRRSTHHAVGKRTLQMVEAYLEYLESGNVDKLIQTGCAEPGPADEEARRKSRPREIVSRIKSDLEELLGSADVLSRIDDWRINYASALLRCESGNSMTAEVDRAVMGGIQTRSRWTYYHHLRILRNRVSEFSRLGEAGAKARQCLDDLYGLRPDEPGFDGLSAESDLRRCIDEFNRKVQTVYQDGLFQSLTELTATFQRQAYFEAFVGVSHLRRRLRDCLNQRGFPEQRLLLYELDCLLEELSYVALRHVASDYEDEHINLPQCLEIIRWCALNLSHDGLHSRQLLDLVEMLVDRSYTYSELTDVLRQIQRNYQHILRQLTAPFESMRDKIGLNHEELRIALANMQRFLHDLNSMAFFADLVLSYIELNVNDMSGRPDHPPTATRQESRTDGIIHLSHREDIWTLVNEAGQSVRASYGGKGSGLIYISYLDIPTPDAFILPTHLARRRAREADDLWLDDMIRRHLTTLEADISKRQDSGGRFGDPDRPLLLAVRGGSVFSMPGILSTVLFVGMNDSIAQSLAATDPWHAYDSYRRFLASYGQEVWGVDVEKYDLVEQAKTRHGVKYKYALPWEVMRDIVEATKNVLRDSGFGDELDLVLNDPFRQLSAAVRAVLDSWNRTTAKRYRQLKGICDSWQSAAIVQEMVSGNRHNEQVRTGMDETAASLTGVVPRTMVTEIGVRKGVGEFKFSACGEDLVGALTTSVSFLSLDELASYTPMLDRRLRHIVTNLRRFMGTDQDIEFTVDRGVLSVLQSRAAEIGANKSSCAFKEPGEAITRGLGIRGSAFRGLAAFDEKDYNDLRASDLSGRDDVDGILVVLENPSPAEIPLLLQAEGMLAAKGGSTSHAAIAINGIEHKDYSAVMSTLRLRVNAGKHEAVIMDDGGNVRATIHKGDIVSIHGSSGMVYLGSQPIECAADRRDEARG